MRLAVDVCPILSTIVSQDAVCHQARYRSHRHLGNWVPELVLIQLSPSCKGLRGFTGLPRSLQGHRVHLEQPRLVFLLLSLAVLVCVLVYTRSSAWICACLSRSFPSASCFRLAVLVCVLVYTRFSAWICACLSRAFFSISCFGFWILASGSWHLASCYWLLASGFLLLIFTFSDSCFGFWLLASLASSFRLLASDVHYFQILASASGFWLLWLLASGFLLLMFHFTSLLENIKGVYTKRLILIISWLRLSIYSIMVQTRLTRCSGIIIR
jgi:hypothetical protein